MIVFNILSPTTLLLYLLTLHHTHAIPIIPSSPPNPPTTITSPAASTASNVPITPALSHGPYTGPPATTTGALSTDILAASIAPQPAPESESSYIADGELHAPQPAPYTPSGGQGTNGTEPIYTVQSDFDFQSLALGLYQEYIEQDLFAYGLSRYSDADFEANGLSREDRYLLRFMAEQEQGHATLLSNMLGARAPVACTYAYPAEMRSLREYVDFSQKVTRWGESGVYGFLNHLDARAVGQLLLQSITTEARQQMVFRQFEGLFPMPVVNQPNPARVRGSDAWNQTLGDYAGTLSTADVDADADDACLHASAVGENCAPAITRNRTNPLSYAGREVFLEWDEPGQFVGPNNSYVTATSAGPPKFAAWVSQLNVTYSPLLNISGNSAYTIQPNMSTYEGDPGINGTMFLLITDQELPVTPFNLSQVNPFVNALTLYQAG